MKWSRIAKYPHPLLQNYIINFIYDTIFLTFSHLSTHLAWNSWLQGKTLSSCLDSKSHMHTTHLKKTMKFKCICYVSTINTQFHTKPYSYDCNTVAILLPQWLQWSTSDNGNWKLTLWGFRGVLWGFLIYCAFTSQSKYPCSSDLVVTAS